jgi:hypothetical protein
MTRFGIAFLYSARRLSAPYEHQVRWVAPQPFLQLGSYGCPKVDDTSGI